MGLAVCEPRGTPQRNANAGNSPQEAGLLPRSPPRGGLVALPRPEMRLALLMNFFQGPVFGFAGQLLRSGFGPGILSGRGGRVIVFSARAHGHCPSWRWSSICCGCPPPASGRHSTWLLVDAFPFRRTASLSRPCAGLDQGALGMEPLCQNLIASTVGAVKFSTGSDGSVSASSPPLPPAPSARSHRWARPRSCAAPPQPTGRPCFFNRSAKASSASSWNGCHPVARQEIEHRPSLVVDGHALAGYRLTSASETRARRSEREQMKRM